MTDGELACPMPAKVIPDPTLGETALVLTALSAYGQHVRRLGPRDAFELAGASFQAHSTDDWRKESVLISMLETYDRLNYAAKRKAS